MDTHRFFVEQIRFHLSEKNKLVFVGWFYDGTMKGHGLTAALDGLELPLDLTINSGAQVRQKYMGCYNEIREEAVGIITLPENFKQGRKLTLYASYEGRPEEAFTITVKKLLKYETEIPYYIESCSREDGTVTVTGWCMGEGEVKLTLLNGKREALPEKTEHYARKDLLPIFPDSLSCVKPGFKVTATLTDYKGQDTFYLKMQNARHVSVAKLKKWDQGGSVRFLLEKAENAKRYLDRNGFAATVQKVRTKLGQTEETSYRKWRKKYGVTADELSKQRKWVFKRQPVFDIIVPLYRTRPAFLKAMIQSVMDQTYGNWRLYLADGSGVDADGRTELTGILEGYEKRDSRITHRTLDENKGISENTNAALAMAQGDYIVLVDHDDLLPPNALYEFARMLNEDPGIDVLYSDEDKVSMDGKKYFDPHFKPDFNLDLLCSINYICHLFCARRELAERAGAFRSAYDGAQDHDFILRCCELAGKICHVDKVLYHWRCHMDSTAANPESKLYAFEAGCRAVESHYKRAGIPARVENARYFGMYRTVYEWQEEPLVSIIIPNKDHAADLAKCVDSILGKSDYRNFEIVVVENNSVEQETFDYYGKLKAQHENVRVVFYEGGFNYSKINNFGVGESKGDYLLLLNNDTEMIGEGCIRELLGYCMRPDVGAVGAKLVYEDETIQHAGVVIGIGGTAGHTFIGKSRYDAGYFGRILCAQDYSAVTAACMMTKRSVFHEVGGLTEELAVAFNDVDYCLKVRETGKLVVYNPYAELFHYESKSRGYEDSPEKVERFNSETETLLLRWKGIMESGDPYYNRNLTLNDSDFSLRR